MIGLRRSAVYNIKTGLILSILSLSLSCTIIIDGFLIMYRTSLNYGATSITYLGTGSLCSMSFFLPGCEKLLTSVGRLQGEPVTLVHIPLDIYPFFIQPILGLLFHDIPPVEDGDETGEDASYTSTSSGLGFFNLSVTPVECSVICSRQLAERYFAPLAAKFNKITSASGGRLSISKDDFIVMQIDGQGLDASQRVLELSSPLAMAGM